ncbi:hypothetical protein G97194_004741 [Escherichia coli]|nr:hypothetical protein G97194_004741 [Escherichia coli]
MLWFFLVHRVWGDCMRDFLLFRVCFRWLIGLFWGFLVVLFCCVFSVFFVSSLMPVRVLAAAARSHGVLVAVGSASCVPLFWFSRVVFCAGLCLRCSARGRAVLYSFPSDRVVSCFLDYSRVFRYLCMGASLFCACTFYCFSGAVLVFGYVFLVILYPLLSSVRFSLCPCWCWLLVLPGLGSFLGCLSGQRFWVLSLLLGLHFPVRLGSYDFFLSFRIVRVLSFFDCLLNLGPVALQSLPSWSICLLPLIRFFLFSDGVSGFCCLWSDCLLPSFVALLSCFGCVCGI